MLVTMQSDRHLLYFADPMCSWCWGFSPVIERVAEEFADRLPVRVMMGGLRAGTTEPMSDRDKDTIKNHWGHVQEASGQPFDFAFFERDGFVYDTELACRGVVAVRRLDAAKALPFLGRVHRRFYALNHDVTNVDELAEIASEIDIDPDDFKASYDDIETEHETKADIWYAQSSGVTGFPTLLAVEDGKAAGAVTIGYRPWSDIGPVLEKWLDSPSTSN